MTWENFYPPGDEELGATAVRRFPVDRPRDVESFNRLSGELHSRQEEASLAEKENWMRTLQDGRTNLLFVGRVFPNKKQDDLVRVFRHYRTLDPTARLTLVGTLEAGDPYAEYLRYLVVSSGLGDAVF